MAGLAFALSMYLRLGDGLLNKPYEPWLINAGLFMGVAAIVYALTGVYRSVWRYVSVRDLAVILRAVTLAVVLFVPLAFLLTRLEGVPRSVPGILWFVAVGFMSGPRLLIRLLREGRLDSFWGRHAGERTNVLVIGASDEAELFIRSTLQDKQSPYHIVGVLDEKGNRVGRQIHNVNILGAMQDMRRVFKELKAKGQAPSRLVVSKSASRSEGFETLLADAQAAGLTLSRLPSITELHAPNAAAPDIKPIALEDLLGRPETVLNRDAITSFVSGRAVMVTGAGGSIGAELSRQIAALSPSRLVLFESSEFNLYSIEMELREAFPAMQLDAVIGDVRDALRVREVMHGFKPALVFHAAALKHVPISENNVRETLLTNVCGTRHVADAAAANGVEAMVLISTDKAVRPTNVMGASKRIAEQYCQALDRENSSKTRFLTVRFGNVLGSTGSVVPRFQEQILRGGPVTVTHPDITRYFMTVREAVELVLQASAHAVTNTRDKGRIMVLDMGKPVKIVELARQMIRLAGLKPDEDVKIVFTGLRAGEKLYEELFSDSEQLTPAGADGVLLAAAEALPLSGVTQGIDGMARLCQNNENEHILRSTIAALVPEFTGAGAEPQRKSAHG